MWLSPARRHGFGGCERRRDCGRRVPTASSWTTTCGRRRAGNCSCPLRGGPRGAQAPSIPLVVAQRHRRPGEGWDTVGVVYVVHGSPLCRRCTVLHYGSRCCYQAVQVGHPGGAQGPACPPVPVPCALGPKVLLRRERQALVDMPGAAHSALEFVPPPEWPTSKRCTQPPCVLGARPPPPPRRLLSKAASTKLPSGMPN